jgi:hypothetical protein
VDGAHQVFVNGLYRVLGYDDDFKKQRPRTDEERRTRQDEWLTLFLFYIANYFVISYFNVAFASVVLNPLDGGRRF